MSRPRTAPPRRVEEIAWDTWVPVDRATLTFVLAGGRILLIRKKRGLGAGKINGPGGRVEPGETPLACAVRETEEELGVLPLDPVALGELRFQFTDGYGIHVVAFRAGRFAGEARETAEAVPLWTPLDAIPYDQMWEDDRHWLPLLLQGRRFRGRFVFEDDRMLDHAIDAEDAASGPA